MSQDPPPVPDGCGLLPYVPRDLVSFISVWRYSAVEGRKTQVAIPVRFSADDDEVSLAKVAGGGIFKAQGRDHNSRLLRGFPAREIIIDGPERQVGEADAPGESAPSDDSPEVEADIEPMTRAWLARFDIGQTRVVKAIRSAARAEVEAARAHTQVAVSFVEKVTAPQLLHQSEALSALSRQLDALRTDLATERASHAQTRATCEAARVEAATLRALMESGGRYVAPTKSWAEILIPSVLREIGPGARVVLASALGLPPDTFAQLAAAAEAPTHAAGP